MARPPCFDKSNVKRGLWTAEEDANHGVGNWTLVPKKAGLNRCGKSRRLRRTNYLRPDLKHEGFTAKEEDCIIKLHKAIGSRWSVIAKQFPGRTENDVKNYWATKLKKKLVCMGIDPITHKPISSEDQSTMQAPSGGQHPPPSRSSSNPKPPDFHPTVAIQGHPSLSFAAVAVRAEVQPRFPEIQLANKSYGKKDGVPSISFSPAEYQAATKKFEHSLVAKFQVRRPPLADVREFMVKNLRLQGKVTISSIWDDRHVAIILDSEDDANAVLASPIRRIGHTLFRLFRWTPDLSSRREETRTTKWVRFPDLPLELFDRGIIRSIVNAFAQFVDIDDQTRTLTGLNYARACVEIDVLEAVPEKVWISLPENKGFFQEIVVEGNMNYCTRCKKHGHSQDSCRKIVKASTGNRHGKAVDTSPAPTNLKSNTLPRVTVASEPTRVETQLSVREEEEPVRSEGASADLPIAEWVEVRSEVQ